MAASGRGGSGPAREEKTLVSLRGAGRRPRSCPLLSGLRPPGEGVQGPGGSRERLQEIWRKLSHGLELQAIASPEIQSREQCGDAATEAKVALCLLSDQVKLIFTGPVDQGKQWRWRPTIILAPTNSTPGTDLDGLCS